MRKQKSNLFQLFRGLFHRLFVVVGAAGMALFFFLILPLMQTLTKPPHTDLVVQAIETGKLEAPPPPPQEEQQDEPEPEDVAPELADDTPPLTLEQLTLALNPGFSGGWTEGDFAVKLNTVASGGSDVDALFSISDLDQKPRIIYQPGPILNKEVRKKAPGTVYIIFIVDQQGKVQDPIIQSSSDPVFEKPALSAVRQWKFEPGKRNGQAVRFRMRVPFTFPKG
ncbi:MAG: energy transducer TonB [Sedimentisphaerales bacterium]|nr:energy transducer TonB [Sedimentisphaerales bacterium]